MSYIYDIVLNFNSDLIEFYEWLKTDNIYHIKRINLIRVDSNIYNDIIDNVVIFNDDFLLNIFNNCEYYTTQSIDTLNYAFLLTDSYRVIGLILDNNGKVIKYSSLLLDEEEDILSVSRKLGNTRLKYKRIRKRNKDDFRTRQEKNIIKTIKKDLLNDYNRKDLNKLKYLYYEYFNQHSDNIEEIYQKLLNELEKDISKKHYDLYHLIKLSLCKKMV